MRIEVRPCIVRSSDPRWRPCNCVTGKLVLVCGWVADWWEHGEGDTVQMQRWIAAAVMEAA